MLSNSLPNIIFLYFFFLVPLFPHTIIASTTTLHRCLHDQRDALIEFIHEFPINKTNPIPHELTSWNESGDCCSWEYVTCDDKYGHVISLDLRYVTLNNYLKHNSSLFRLQNLQTLILSRCDLYGEITSSIGNLSSLTHLDLSSNKLSGNIPISLTNLTTLSYFDISTNHFNTTFPYHLSSLHNLKYLFVRDNSFSGPFPTFLLEIPTIIFIDLKRNQFFGPIAFENTSSILSNVELLYLDNNKFDGIIPESISEIKSLELLFLSHNNFIGKIPTSISKLVSLNLQHLDLSHNKLEGQVPGCLWIQSTMQTVTLSHNSFDGFGESPTGVFDGDSLIELNLGSNSLGGPFPHWICNNKFLKIIDLSNNHFNGSIPRCFQDSVYWIKGLNLRNNSFSGILPDMFFNASMLMSLDISNNELEGKLPRSLIDCTDISLVNVGNNRIKDTFPSWLGSLSSLRVLILRSNAFHGPLHNNDPKVSTWFQRLKVIDISNNDFSGTLPSSYFSTWSEMEKGDTIYNEDWYMEESGPEFIYNNSITMIYKGVDTDFSRLPYSFGAIDFSRNRFRGSIPESIGFLKELHLLNLSGNSFAGNIPQSLQNLKNLEALDLSRNQLSGHIPRYLDNLSFLSTMNFSHNLFEGPVPRGTQFQRQKCSSFMDNPKLYDIEQICGKTHIPQEFKDLLEPEEQMINWIVAAIAYGPGVFFGLVIAHIFFSHKRKRFMKKV
ncbi:unnamed protein product [Cochlearia groenlandica]